VRTAPDAGLVGPCPLDAALARSGQTGVSPCVLCILNSLKLCAGCRSAWAIWGCNVAAFLAARVTEGLPFALVLGPRAAWLDSHRGALRWHICYNLTVLRMLSYALDLHWARLARAAARGPAAAVAAAAAPRTPRERQRCELPSEADYGLLPCLAHALYPPLYLAGPIISFQDFAWQLRGPPPPPAAAADGSASAAAAPTSAAAAAVLRYALRLAADLACLEAVTHFLYFNSLAVHRVGARYAAHGLAHGAPQVGLAAWWVLTFMWLKFATIWRTTRLAALAAGVEAPENMVRCFADNYEVEGFWRGWHASYNRWLVRYMYVPMGGGARRALTIWPIFLFVALWHDLDWRLLSWAWLACLAFLPEMAAKRAAAAPRFDAVRGGAGFRALAAAAAALNIAGLMGANMVGFVVGADGAAALVRQLAAAPAYVAAALAAFFCAAQLMFALRAREAGSKAA
jgi:D-alanyl-lipoteichoic acid acyltransferase DltB (MBOAT superfamily)